MIYSIILFAVTILPFLFGFSGLLYLISALFLIHIFVILHSDFLKVTMMISCYMLKSYSSFLYYTYIPYFLFVIDMAL